MPKRSRNRAAYRNSPLAALPTAGQVLTDGRILEVVQPKPGGPLALLIWNGKRYAIRSRIQVHGQPLIAPAIEGTAFEKMRLPRAPRPFDSVGWLLTCISENVSKYCGLSLELAKLIARFCLCSWVSEALPSRLSLHVIGPTTNAGMVLMDLLSCFCHHALFLAQIDIDSIASIPRGLCPTIVYSGQLTRTTRHLLEPHHMRTGILRGRGQRIPIEYMTVIYSPSIADVSNSPTALEIPILSAEENCPPLSREILEHLGEELQSRLLSFRLKTLAQVATCEFRETRLQFPTRELARVLGCCTPENADLQSELATLLAGTDHGLRVEQSTTPESLVIEGLLFLVHEENRERLHVGELTEVINTIRAGRGERSELKARSVGHIVRTLGLKTERLDGAGRGVFLLTEIREFIHHLARQFAVPSATNGPRQCEFCAKK